MKSKIMTLLVSVVLLLVMVYFSDEVSFLSRIVSVENIAGEEKKVD
ncbi:hypothetical protein [Bacteroides sp. D20]|nr:hypothetical protein [Bacteroides sp. D20]